MRCEAHDLAAGPDGLCAVCLRERRSLAAGRAQRSGGRIVLLLFGVSAALLASYAFRRALPARIQLAAEPAQPSVAQKPAVVSTAPVAGEPPRPPIEAAPAVPVDPPSAHSPAARIAGSVVPPAPEPDPFQPTPAQLQAALRSTPVVMFSAGWCPACKAAKSFLADNGIAYQNRDIDDDPAALAELKRRSGASSIPLIVIDGEQLAAGFSAQAMSRSLVSSVERRLHVQDLRMSLLRSPG
jgi:glutaredoxin-like protein NrdH